MVTKKTAPCACEDCKCDPCECGKSGTCCSKEGGCCSSMKHHIGWAGWLRIAIAVLLVVGAYAAGVIAGMDAVKGDRYGRSWGEGRGENMMGRSEMSREKAWKKQMPMMDHDMGAINPMNMSDMGKMLEGNTGDALNKAFLKNMITHHQAAVDMAKYLAGSNKPELVKLGGEIITAQTAEIEQMKKWMEEWGYTSTGATASGMMIDHSMMP